MLWFEYTLEQLWLGNCSNLFIFERRSQMKCKRRSSRKKWVLIHRVDGKRRFFEGITILPNTDCFYLHAGRNIEEAYTFNRKNDARECIAYINNLYESGSFEKIWHIDGKPDFQVVSL